MRFGVVCTHNNQPPIMMQSRCENLRFNNMLYFYIIEDEIISESWQYTAGKVYYISITTLRIKIQEIPYLPLGSDVVCYLLLSCDHISDSGDGIYRLLSSI